LEVKTNSRSRRADQGPRHRDPPEPRRCAGAVRRLRRGDQTRSLIPKTFARQAGHRATRSRTGRSFLSAIPSSNCSSTDRI